MSLPPWADPLPDAAAMRQVDRWASEQAGIPTLELMERAGRALADEIGLCAPDALVAVVCGTGNNGGDGLVAARLLRLSGRRVAVVAVGDLTSAQGDAARNLERLPGDAPVALGSHELDGAAVVVDAVLGTGGTGAPRGPAAVAIDLINASRDAGAQVISVDVPSGVDASDGTVAAQAVRADVTVTFHRATPGLWIAPGKGFVGDLRVADIGIPAGAPGTATVGLIGRRVLDGLPVRGASSSKFTSGTVVVIGGSGGMVGAPTMAARAAQRAGAGYVTVAAPASLAGSLGVTLLEAMTRALPETDGVLTLEALDPALQAVGRADAVVLGPGLGRAPATQRLVRELVRRIQVPLVVDADGLNACVGRLQETFAVRSAPTVLTPHAGELGRLLGVGSRAIGVARLAHARAAASAADAIVVLKGDDTLVVSPDGRTAISPGGAPALATAGTGDVLAGTVGALLARGLAPAWAASAGVLAHLHAGRLAAQPHGPSCVIASDVIEQLPAALAAG